MHIRALAAENPAFDRLLRVVPRTTGVRHKQRHHYAGHGRAGEQAAEGFHAEELANDDGKQNRRDAWENHLLECGGGRDIHATGRVRLHAGPALEEAGNLAELTADFLDHALRRATDGGHRLRADKEGHHAPDEEPDHDHRIDEVEPRLIETDRRGVGREERQRGEGRRANREALADRRGGVAEGVEAVGDLADFGAEVAHLGDTAGVVGDWAVRINGHRDADRREHTHGRNGDTIETRGPDRHPDRAADE